MVGRLPSHLIKHFVVNYSGRDQAQLVEEVQCAVKGGAISSRRFALDAFIDLISRCVVGYFA